MSGTEWYWCLTHSRPETGDDRDDPFNSLGPYDSPDAATNWRDRVEVRNDEWQDADDEWFGDDGDNGDDGDAQEQGQ